jgi:hypothetical protein
MDGESLKGVLAWGVSFDSAAQMARCSCFSPLVRMQM